jgi:hypothetical protein
VERQVVLGKHHGKDPCGKFPQGGKVGKTRDKAARGLGTSGRTLEKIKQVVETGDKELIAEMDKKKKVDPVYRKMKLRRPLLFPLRPILLPGKFKNETKKQSRFQKLHN